MEVSGQLHNQADLSVGKEPNLPVEYGPRIAQGTLQGGGGGGLKIPFGGKGTKPPGGFFKISLP
jgi:hypothetical protein